MDFPERCLQLCEYITTLSHVHTTLLHILTRAFLSPPFQGGCALEGSACTALRTHLFGAYEAQRWGGSYIYPESVKLVVKSHAHFALFCSEISLTTVG